MMVVSLSVNVGFDAPCKVLNADGIRLHGLFAPVPRSGLAHEIHRDQCVYNTVLNEVKNAQKCVSPFTVLIKDAFQYDMQDWVSAMECNDDPR